MFKNIFHCHNRLCCVAAYLLTYSQSALPCYLHGIEVMEETALQLLIAVSNLQTAYGYPCYRISTLNSTMQACAHVHSFQSFPAALSSQQQYCTACRVGQALSSDTVCTVQYTAVRMHTAAQQQESLFDLHLPGSFTGGMNPDTVITSDTLGTI